MFNAVSWFWHRHCCVSVIILRLFCKSCVGPRSNEFETPAYYLKEMFTIIILNLFRDSSFTEIISKLEEKTRRKYCLSSENK